MGRNNICVIYDSDENYAKRLMSVINDDNDIPYNAQVFTKEHELDKYLQEKEADMLMICEGAYGYNAYRTGNKTVVLCEEEREADEINSREEKGLVGICKYQPSYQLLQSVMRYEKKDRVQKRGSLKVTGVYGFNNTARMMLSLAVARLMSEHGNTLFINFETFYGFKGILKGEENENLSDALYAFRQNHNQFHKNIVNAISHYERLDYIPDASCAEDIDDIKPEEMGTFIQAIGRELGYSNIVIDIGDGIRMPWNMMDCCDEIYMCETGNYIENMRLKNFEKYLLEQGMDNIAATFKKIHVNEDENINNDDICDLIADTGISIPISTIVSSLVSISFGLLACPVDRLPSCPVFIACNISIASGPLTSPTTIRSGRILRLAFIKSLILTALVPSEFATLASSLTILLML